MQVSDLKIGQKYIYKNTNYCIKPLEIIYAGNLSEIIKDPLTDEQPFKRPFLFFTRGGLAFFITKKELCFLREHREMGGEFWVVCMKNRAPEKMTADKITNLFTLDAVLHQDKQSALDELNSIAPERRRNWDIQKFKCIPVEE